MSKNQTIPNDRQIITLIKNHAEGKEQEFYSAALKIAAQEARKGNRELAVEIRNLIDKGKDRTSEIDRRKHLIPSIQEKSNLANMLSVWYPDTKLPEMILPPEAKSKLELILAEQKQRSYLQEYNLSPRRKILLVSPPGFGKTMTANVLAGELQLPLFTIACNCLTKKAVGELKLIFDTMTAARGVYFFDGFGEFVARYNKLNSSDEFLHILNSFFLFLGNETSESLIIVTANHKNIFSKSLLRKFDDIVEQYLVTEEMIYQLLATRLILFDVQWEDRLDVLEKAKKLSPAEIVRAADEAAKKAIVSHTNKISKESLLLSVSKRQNLLF